MDPKVNATLPGEATNYMTFIDENGVTHANKKKKKKKGKKKRDSMLQDERTET